MKIILKYILMIIVLTGLFLGALLAVSFIPKDDIKKHAKESAIIMIAEGEKKSVETLSKHLYTENSTDAIMVNLSYTIDPDNKLESVIKARRNYLPGITTEVKSDIVGDLPHESSEYLMTNELFETVNNKKQVSYEYTRYWHGYIVILRILLMFFNIFEIRLITQVIFFALIGLLMYYLKKNSNWKIAISLLFSFIAVNLFVWHTALQGAFVIIIALIISIFSANKKINEKNMCFWLFISGALTAYLDFLTIPIVTALLPILTYTAVNVSETNVKTEFITFIKRMTSWGVGYLGLWVAKWILADLIYDMGIIRISIEQIFYRIGTKHNVQFFGIAALVRNLDNHINYLVTIIYLFLLLYSIFKIKKYEKGYFWNSQKIPYYLSAITPIAWFLIVADHSYFHFFFTYKAFLITILAIMCIVFDDRNGKYLKIKNKE